MQPSDWISGINVATSMYVIIPVEFNPQLSEGQLTPMLELAWVKDKNQIFT